MANIKYKEKNLDIPLEKFKSTLSRIANIPRKKNKIGGVKKFRKIRFKLIKSFPFKN